MTGQQSAAVSPEPAAVASPAPNLPSPPRDLGSRYRALTPYRKRRFNAIAGGLAVGLGIGIVLAWIIGIYQRANPQSDITAAGNTSQAYPAMGLTFFVIVIIAGSAIGLGLGYIAASLIPLDSERQGRLEFQEPGQEAVHERG